MYQTPTIPSAWQQTQTVLRSIFSEEIFTTWFSQLQYVSHDQEKITLAAPNDFAIIWIQDNYLDHLRRTIEDSFEQPLRLQFEVSQGNNAPAPQPLAHEDNSADAPASQRFPQKLSGTERAEILSRKKKPEAPKLNPRNTFSNFVVGSDSQMAHATCLAVANAPGQAFNPLFLYGATGLGKTHLMQAVAHEALAKNPMSRVEYISCEKFTNDWIKAIQENSLAQFRRRYRGVDLLLIDDIQFLAGKERTQEEFFHTFNDLFESQKQIIISSDRPASEINKLESRLVSRFQWGMVADIQPPDLETRVAILSKKAESLNVYLSDEIIQFLAERVSRNVRRMEGALTRVASFASFTRDPIDIPCVERLLQDLLSEEAQQQISIEDIKKNVVEYYRLKTEDMESRRRPAKIAFPRQIAMYLSRVLTSHSLSEIGESFGGRDHGTVIHACKTVEDMMDQDDTVKRSVDYLTKMLAKSY